jgi:hypothetical protein
MGISLFTVFLLNCFVFSEYSPSAIRFAIVSFDC